MMGFRVNLTPELDKQLRVAAAEDGISKSQMVRDAITEYLIFRDRNITRQDSK